ncbi:L-glutamate gamma-semialdehyde dehydrogenase [Kytococcus schroeteri]|uniref:L-glutamate gamma-semialdehyde dehydrogenase n=1 Tax=Kytococcus schroeteri TaxID=138300 RepID=UPI00114359FC|nr:L-glutamate gamma-semialdehyde dehydrogenase [Kytococcus schroeteri]
MDAVTLPPQAYNEPVKDYAPGSPERAELEVALAEIASNPVDLPHVIGGERVTGSGEEIKVVQPHAHAKVLGTLHDGTAEDAKKAVEAAKAAAPAWQALPFDERAAILLRAADLLTGPWRARMNAATMLGQSKTPHQAEIESACEMADFWRFNVQFAREILEEQPPVSPNGSWNRTDWRPLDGFVYAVTPFNFTAIAGNLPTAPALMGNTVVWKPSITQARSAQLVMELLEEAGMPAGVINLVHGTGPAISEVVLADPDFAGLHFTGSTATFKALWKQIGDNIDTYRQYPRIVGETGGKDFVLAHPSADSAKVITALLRGAFEYQGQKCSAASRAYIPKSMWAEIKDEVARRTDALPMGDVTDFSNFMGAVIDDRAFAKHKKALDAAQSDSSVEIVAGGTYDDSVGYFVRPTVVVVEDPKHEMMTTEYFGPILAVYVYEDDAFEDTLELVANTTDYALTGAVLSTDRYALEQASKALRFAAGNYYVNDKPTGAVVGQQPFGGSGASGTNDKAGSKLNLLRWVSARSIKETFDAPTSEAYPYQG